MEFLMNATVGQLIGSGFGILTFILLFIEFTPIKVNPISSVLRWIGERTNKELDVRIDKMENKVEEIYQRQTEAEEEYQKREAINARIRILRFGDEVRRKMKHSQESFDQVLSDIDTYEKYCKDHPKFENKKTVRTSKLIVDTHDKCMLEDDFL